ncbi:S26 family signal peptidase [Blastomonas sp.]|uniref:S26 family signal peptidase n=1 Tax=Blastomonas sp. TaxID=1909299 RepID=UPI00406A3FF1
MSRRLWFAGGLTVALTLGSIALPESRVLIWNVSASVPTGFYWVAADRPLQTGRCVAIKPAPAIRRWLASRGYLPPGVPLIKRIAALEGQEVCRFRHGITIDGRLVALARARDTLGRPLPVWSGCRTLGPDTFFALNAHRADSLDGRYFGPMPRSVIIGMAIPVRPELPFWIRMRRPSGRASACSTTLQHKD